MVLGISATSVRRILKVDLGLKPYKKVIEPSLSDDQKIKREKNCGLSSKQFSKRGNHENSRFEREIFRR